MTWQTVVDPALCGRLCLVLVHSLWQVAFLAAAAWCFERLWRRRSPRAGYAIYVAALIAALLEMPITYALIGDSRPYDIASADTATVADLPAATFPTAGEMESDIRPVQILPEHGRQPSEIGETANINSGAALLPAPAAAPAANAAAAASVAWWFCCAPWIAAVYALGVLIMLVRLIRGMWRAQRLMLAARPIVAGPLAERIGLLARAWSLRIVPALVETEAIVTPKVVGLLRPTILLPLSAVGGLSLDELEMILVHELAHVRRYDMWINLLQRLAETVLFFNPFLWFISRRIGTLREYCCDEFACRATSGSNTEHRTRYAAALLRIAELGCRDSSRFASCRTTEHNDLAALAAAGRSPSELRRRIARLFGEPLPEPVRLSRGGLITMLVLAAALLVGPITWTTIASPGSSSSGESQPSTEKTTDVGNWQPGQILDFCVINAQTKEPLSGVKLDLQCHGPGINFQDIKTYTTDALGRADLKLPERRPDAVRVYPSKPGFVPLRVYWGNDLAAPKLPKSVTVPMQPGTVWGGIVRNEKGEPIPGVKVNVRYWERTSEYNPHLRVNIDQDIPGVTTDKDGRWRMDILPETFDDKGPRLFFTHSDYVSDHLPRYCSPLPVYEKPSYEALRNQTAVIVMRKGTTISGWVTDESGKPISGALVCNQYDCYDPEPFKITTTTNNEGHFRLSGLSQRDNYMDYFFTIQAAGYAPVFIEVPDHSSANLVDIKLKRGETVQGKVVDENGKPLEGVSIKLDYWMGRPRQFYLKATTNAAGKFRIEGAPSERTEYDIEKKGFITVRRPLPPSSTDYTITLRSPLRVSGSIVDAETNKPLAKCRLIKGWDYEDGRNPEWETAVGFPAKEVTNGQYEFEFTLEHGTRIRAEAEGYMPTVSRLFKPGVLDKGRVTYDFKLTKAASLSGTVLGLDDKPLAGAEVFITTQQFNVKKRKPGPPVGEKRRMVKTGDKGRFEFPPEVEPFYLVVLHDQGFAVIDEKQFAKNAHIHIQPWTKENQNFTAERRPSTGRMVSPKADAKSSLAADAEAAAEEDTTASSDKSPSEQSQPDGSETNKTGNKTFQGTVLDEAGKPVVDADVWLSGYRKSDSCRPYIRHVKHVKSDSKGRFTFNVPSAWISVKYPEYPVTIWVYAPEHQLGIKCFTPQTITLLKDDEFTLEMRLKPAADTTFTVLDSAEGKPLVDALVQPYRVTNSLKATPDEVLRRIESRTDAAGRVKFPSVGREELNELRIIAKDFGIQIQRYSDRQRPLPADNIIRLRWAGRIEGRLIADKPEWAKGVLMRIRTMDSLLPQGLAEIETDEQGRFSVPFIANGELRFEALVDEKLPVRPQLPTSANVEVEKTTELRIPMIPVVSIRGSVRVKDSNTPIAGVRILIQYDNTQMAYCESDPQGLFTANVLPGRAAFNVSDASHEYVQFGDEIYHDISQRESNLPPLELVPAKNVTGRLIDETGRPLAATTINCLLDDHRCGFGQSDANGNFKLFGVPKTINTTSAEYFQVWKIYSGRPEDLLESKVIQSDPLIIQVQTSSTSDDPQMPPDAAAPPAKTQTRKELPQSPTSSQGKSFTLQAEDSKAERRPSTGRMESPKADVKNALLVRVVDESDKPVEGAHVSTFMSFYAQPKNIAPHESNWSYMPNIISGRDGIARIPKSRMNCIVAHHVERKLVAIQGIDQEQLKRTDPLTITMHPQCRIHGKLTAKELKALKPNFSWSNQDSNWSFVYLLLNDGRGRPMNCAAGDGNFHFYAPPGKYILDAYSTDTHHVRKPITVKPGQEELEVEPIDLPPTGLVLLEGKPAPELRDIRAWKNGGPVKILDLRGKVVILVFTMDWSGKHMAEMMPPLFEIFDKYHDQGLEMIEIRLDQNPVQTSKADIKEKTAKVNIPNRKGRILPIPIAFAPVNKLPTRPPSLNDTRPKSAYTVLNDYGINGIPKTILIDRQGRVVGGSHPLKPDNDVIEKLLKEKSGKEVNPAAQRIDMPVIIARHVMLLDGREIITWAELEKRIAALPDPSQAYPHFYATRGAYEAGIYKTAKEEIWRLHRKFKLKGHSEGSLSPQADFRYDRIKTAADLVPDKGLQVEGQVIDNKGDPVNGAEVLLIKPVDKSIPYKSYEVALVEGHVRNPLQYVITLSDDKGQFAIYPPKKLKSYVVALHPTAGFALVRQKQFLDDGKVRLIPWATLTSRFIEEAGRRQEASLRTRVEEKDSYPEINFTQYWSDLKKDRPTDTFCFEHVPPILETTLERTFPEKEGGAFSLPGATVSLLPGESRRLDLDTLSEKQHEWLERLRKVSRERSETAPSHLKPVLPPSKNADKQFQLRVVGPDGKPVAHAEVEVRGDVKPAAEEVRQGKFLKRGPYGAFYESDEQGRLAFALSKTPQRFSLSIKQPGFGPYWAEWDSSEHPQPLPAEFTAELESGWRIGGVVVDGEGKPLAGAKIDPSIEYKKRPGDFNQLYVGANISTDAEGRWSFACVPDSMQEVSVAIDQADYKPLRRSLTRGEFGLEPGQEPKARLTLERGLDIKGTVRDEAGNPLAGALLRTKFLNDMRQATSGADGTYRLVGCEPRMTRVAVSAAGKARDFKEVRVEAGMEPVDFVMKPGGKIRVRVIGQDDKPVARARIFFQRWRGPIEYFEFEDVNQYTDNNGVWQWDEAPLDEIKADICPPGGMQLLEQSLKAGEREHVFHCLPPLVISGDVTDAATGRPVKKFRVVPGIRSGNPNAPYMNWARGESFEAVDGHYQLRPDRANLAHLVRIEADGYEVVVSREIKSDEGNVKLGFQLKPAADVAATILTPADKPAAGAKIAIGIPESQINVDNGDIADGGTYAARRNADEAGRFRFPNQGQEFQLVITHPSGFAHLKSSEGPIPATIRLTPWARVEGTFRVGRQTVPNVAMSLSTGALHSYGPDVPNIFASYEVTTSADGRFVFERVFPDKGWIGRRILLMVDDGAMEVTSSKKAPASFAAGETTKLDIGGDGRAVVGKLMPPAGFKGKVLWNFAMVRVKVELPKLKSPPVPDGVSNDLDKRKEWLAVWKVTDEGKAWQAECDKINKIREASPSFDASIGSDGSFRIDDVPVGDYVLSVRFEPHQHQVGTLSEYRFLVLKNADADDKPIDLGIISLKK